jgi:two-component system chemotaxis response regulator CheB
MNSRATNGSFEMVAVGASAGGVQALQSILRQLPEDFAPAMLVVLHLPPDRPSRLASLLAQQCRLPLSEALDKQPIVPGTVTIAPPNYHLLVEQGRTLALSVDEPVLFSRPAIDPMFESAASVYGDRLLAVLLTGASSDGSVGAAAVRRFGGSLWVEDPDTALVSSMPASALRHAGADEVLCLQEIGRRLADMKRT